MRAVMDAPDPTDGAPETGEVLDLPVIGSERRPFLRKDSRALEGALRALCLDMRFNLRSQRIEWRGEGAPDEPATEWRAVNRRFLAETRERVAQEFRVKTKDGPQPLAWGRDTFGDTLDAMLRRHEVDPLIDWLENLPPWDGEDRLRLLLNHLFDVPPDELSMWASRHLVCGVIQRTFEPGNKLDEIPVLIGPQDIGKSALLRAILPPEMPDLFGDALEWDAPGKTQVEATLGKAIVEVSEMAGRRRAEIEQIKAFISRQDDGGVRLAYATNPEPLPRRFILVATTNNESDLPNDPSGNRRFVPIPATGNRVGRIEEVIDRHRSQLWAEGMAEYFDGYRANLPRDLMPAQRERAELHRDRDDVLEDAVQDMHGDGPYPLKVIMQDMLGEAAKGASQHRVARALRNAGWELIRRKREGRVERVWVRK